MKSKKQITENKHLKTKKKVLQKTKDPEIDLDFDTTSMNYFRIIKELEKQNMEKKSTKELIKKEPKPKQKNLTEKIYLNNSIKLGNYYNKNKNDLLLYGSSNYDVLEMDKLVDEMGNYKSKIINKINENHNKNKKIKNSQIDDIIDDYDSAHNKVILTPLAENEKERREMEALEKKKYDEAKRIGVVMRRIEYTYLLNNKTLNGSKNGDSKEMINKLKASVDKIERSWLRYRKRKTKRMKENAKRGHIEIQYLSVNDNIKKLKELEKSYQMLKVDKDRLDGENKELQILLDEKTSDKDEELNGIKEKYDEKLKEFETLNLAYNELLTEKNLLNDKNNEITSEYETISKQNSEKDEKIKELEEKIKELEEKIDSVNKEKSDFENDNKLLKDKINNLDGEFDNFKKTKTFQDSENENKLKQIEENYNKEKEDLNKNIIELQNDINKKNKEIEEQKNIINDYESKYKELETKYNDMSQLKQDTENEINKLKEDINTKETENNKLNEEKNGKDDEINKLKGEIEEKDNEIKKINLLLDESKNKNDEYQKEIDSLKLNMSNSAETDKIKINELEKEKNTLNNQINKLEEEKNDLKDTSNILESLVSESKEKYNKLFSQSKAKISKLNKEKEKLNEEIINLKNENLTLKANNNEKDNVNDMEKKYNYEIIKENNNYEKKISRLNKVIEELNNRIQVLYVELANKENNNNINKDNINEPIKE